MTLFRSLFAHSSKNNCIFDRTKHLEPRDSWRFSERQTPFWRGQRCRKSGDNRIKVGGCGNNSLGATTCVNFFSIFLQRKHICRYLWQASYLQFILLHPAFTYVQFDPLCTDMTVPFIAGHKNPTSLSQKPATTLGYNVQLSPCLASSFMSWLCVLQ